jgi:hypothetical protein
VHLLWFKYYDGRVPHIQREMGSFWWKDIFRLKDLYGGITTWEMGLLYCSGKTIGQAIV